MVMSRLLRWLAAKRITRPILGSILLPILFFFSLFYLPPPKAIATPQISHATADIVLSSNAFTWTTQTLDSTSGWFAGTTLDLDSSEQPVIGYAEATRVDDVTYGELKYARLENDSWITKTLVTMGCFDRPGSSFSLALDSLDRIHAAYHYFDCASLKYLVSNETLLLMETVDTGTVQVTVGAFASLALDSNDTPHIGYAILDYTPDPDSAMYARRDATGWITEALEIDDHTWYTSLALDSDDQPHIIYHIRGELKYTWYNGYQWYTDTITHTDHDDISLLVLDGNNHPHIAFSDSDDLGINDRLVYAWNNGTDWTFETVITQTTSGTSLALDSYDNPHLSYVSNGLVYAYRDMSGWHSETVDMDSLRRKTSLALDHFDQPHISYVDSSSRILKYAYKRPITYLVYLSLIWKSL
jgi:hypothetical protein